MARTIQKEDIVKQISEECGVGIQCAEQMIASFVDQIVDATMVGNKVNIPDFWIIQTGNDAHNARPQEAMHQGSIHTGCYLDFTS